jgi:hypothetical protein
MKRVEIDGLDKAQAERSDKAYRVRLEGIAV